MGLLGFFHDSSLFYSPVTSIQARAHDDRHCERESESGRCTGQDRSNKIFGCIGVWTKAACMAGEFLSIVLCPSGVKSEVASEHLRAKGQIESAAVRDTWYKHSKTVRKSEQVVISSIGAGGDCSFAVVCRKDAPGDPVDFRKTNSFSEIATLTSEIVDQVGSLNLLRG